MTIAWLLLLAAPAPEVPWEVVGTEGGVRLESRPVATSGCPEFRVTTTTPLSVETLCTAIFEWGSKGTDYPDIKQRKLLADGKDERVSYDQIEQPIVSNRDYAMTVRRVREGDTCRIRFWATNERAPPRPEGWVRIEKLWGSWSFTPKDGGTELVYMLFADPAGSIPAMLVRGTQRDAALNSVRLGLEKARGGGAEMSGEALCLSCGLCCDGSLFALVAIDSAEARVLRDAGVEVLDEAGRLKLPQRCGALDGCRCRVYPARPAGCRRFTCLLLHALEHGELGLEEAKAEVETTRARLARLEGLLPKAAPGDRSGPVLRAATIHRQGGRISDAASAAWDEADEQLRRRFVSR